MPEEPNTTPPTTPPTDPPTTPPADPPATPPPGDTSPPPGDAEIKLEDVVEVEPDKLSEEQKTFLNENKGELTDEQREKYSIEPDEEKPLDPSKIKIKVRTKQKKTTKPAKGGDGDGDGEGEIDPEDRATMSKVVAEETADLRKQNQVVRDEVELDTFIRANPEYTKYRAVALKYMKNPSHSNLPASSIMAIISAEDQQAIGAKKERETQKKVGDTQTGGNQVRTPVGGKVDWSKATPEQVEAKRVQVISRR